MHVCLVVQNYYRIDPRVRRKADSLAQHGHQVDVIALREEGLPRVFRQNGVTVHSVPLRKKRGGRLRYVYEYAAFWLLAFIMLAILSMRKRYQVVEVNTLPDFLIFAALVPKLLGARLLLDMHEVMPEFYISKFGVAPEGRFIRLLEWQEGWSLRFADHALASNDLIAERLVARGLLPSKVTTVMNSADPRLFDSQAATRLATDADRGEPTILMYHGTLTDIYGLDVAIDAMDRVRARRPDLAVEFHILGTGPAQESLVAQAERLGMDDRVRFLGRVPLDEVPIYVARCDIGLLPTRSDVFLDLSFSNKLVEYVVMGKPVIAADLPGYRRYFRDRSLAFFEPVNPDSLAEAIIDLAQERGRWSDLVNNALLDYQPISWEVMEGRYLSIMERLAAGLPSPMIMEEV